MSFIDKTRNSLSNVGKTMNPAFITYGFIGITTVILGYYTFFENNIEEPVQETAQPPSAQPPSAQPPFPQPSFMQPAQTPSFMQPAQTPLFMQQQQQQPQQISGGGTKTNKQKIKKTKKRKN